MSNRRNTFSSRLTRTIIVIVMVVMTIITLVAFAFTSSGIYTSFRKHFIDASDNISSTITANLEKVEISATNIADEVKWHINSPEQIISTLEYEIEVNRHLAGCGVGFLPDYFPSEGRWFEPYGNYTESGSVVRNIGSASHDYHESEWFKSGLAAGGGNWSKPYYDTDGAGMQLCTYSLPIINPDGVLAGVFGADMSLNWLADLLHDIDVRENELGLLPSLFNRKDQGIFSFIIGPEGDYIIHPDKNRFNKGENFFDYAGEDRLGKYRLLGEEMCAGETGERMIRMDGRKYNVFFAPLLHSGWSMAIAVPSSSLMWPAIAFGSIILLLMLLGLAIVFRICRNAIRKFTKPLVQLADSATEVAKGKFDTPLPEIETEDEIRLLRDSFDNMQQSLSHYIADLTETTAQKASMENELGVARNIQMAMLPMTWPAFPDRNDIDIYGGVTPAKAVGGDLYDFCVRNDKLFFCIGDVSGKGIPASLVMAVISSMFRTLSSSEDCLDKIVSVINSSMASRNENLMFVTLFTGELNLKTGELKYCNAGHNAPYLLVDGTPQLLDAGTNVPVGIMEDWKYTLQSRTLAPGTTLFLFTDGLNEATRSDGTLFGDDRILSCLAAQPANVSPRDLAANMSAAVSEFVGDAEQSDDLTMLVIKVLPH